MSGGLLTSGAVIGSANLLGLGITLFSGASRGGGWTACESAGHVPKETPGANWNGHALSPTVTHSLPPRLSPRPRSRTVPQPPTSNQRARPTGWAVRAPSAAPCATCAWSGASGPGPWCHRTRCHTVPHPVTLQGSLTLSQKARCFPGSHAREPRCFRGSHGVFPEATVLSRKARSGRHGVFRKPVATLFSRKPHSFSGSQAPIGVWLRWLRWRRWRPPKPRV